ncbi:MAG: hypothetical protein ACXWFS_08835, partial [Thermoanaerobaculia bacterium]
VCETEGCGLDVPAADLELYQPATRIPEGALEAAIAEARTPAPVKGANKRALRAKAVAEPAGDPPAEAAPERSRQAKNRKKS